MITLKIYGLVFGRCSVPMAAKTQMTQTEDCRGFGQYLQANSRIVSRFAPQFPSKCFPIHHPAIRSHNQLLTAKTGREKKSKGIPVIGRGGPTTLGCWGPIFQTIRTQDSHYIRAWIDCRAKMRLKGLDQMRNPITSSGFESTPLQLVA
jgi:hypothetical protein